MPASYFFAGDCAGADFEASAGCAALDSFALAGAACCAFELSATAESDKGLACSILLPPVVQI